MQSITQLEWAVHIVYSLSLQSNRGRVSHFAVVKLTKFESRITYEPQLQKLTTMTEQDMQWLEQTYTSTEPAGDVDLPLILYLYMFVQYPETSPQHEKCNCFIDTYWTTDRDQLDVL